MQRDKISSLLEDVNLKDIEEFKTMTPLQKSRTILKDFASFHRFREKYSDSYSEEEKERFIFEQERFFNKANKELKLLSIDELIVFLSVFEKKVIAAVNEVSDRNKLKNKLIFNSVSRAVRSLEINDVNVKAKIDDIDILIYELDAMSQIVM